MKAVLLGLLLAVTVTTSSFARTTCGSDNQGCHCEGGRIVSCHQQYSECGWAILLPTRVTHLIIQEVYAMKLVLSITIGAFAAVAFSTILTNGVFAGNCVAKTSCYWSDHGSCSRYSVKQKRYRYGRKRRKRCQTHTRCCFPNRPCNTSKGQTFTKESYCKIGQ